jgi:hypothetical protein
MKTTIANMCENIKLLLDNVSQKIEDLDQEKNIDKILKQYNKNIEDIKFINDNILLLKHKFENNIIDISQIISEEQYEIYCKELTEEKINKIIDCDNISEQIEEYKHTHALMNQCKKYLESKKINIVECDKIFSNTTQNKSYQQKYKKKTNIENIKKVTSDDSDNPNSDNSNSDNSNSDDI